jgi:hypothetical protein
MNGIFAKLKELTRKTDGSFNPIGLIIIGVVLLAVAPVIFAVLFLAYTTYDEISSEPQSKQNQLEVEKEFHKIQPPPNATPTSTNLRFTRKTNHGTVGMLYQGNLAYSEIRAHYDAELTRNGWKFQNEEKVIYRGQDYGGKEVVYTKGKYEAIIYFPGTQPDADFTFGLNVSWET